MPDDAPEAVMQEVLRLAAAALELGEFPIAAVAVLDGRVLATAHTTERAEGRLLVHAELRALEAADRLRLSTAERRRVRLYTNLEPCLMCLGAAMSFRLGELYYGLESPADGACGVVTRWARAAGAIPAGAGAVGSRAARGARSCAGTSVGCRRQGSAVRHLRRQRVRSRGRAVGPTGEDGRGLFQRQRRAGPVRPWAGPPGRGRGRTADPWRRSATEVPAQEGQRAALEMVQAARGIRTAPAQGPASASPA